MIILRTNKQKIGMHIYRKKKRKKNRNNKTVAYNIFPMECVTIGKGTYGELHIMSYLPSAEKLEIGNYVSIAPNVHFILGGNHQSKTLTTFPILSTRQKTHHEKDAYTKGPIIIEDDVWIGYGATILSGVRIGQGAIIGACSVISKDIPPYAIVVGNPAKIIKYRFPHEVIKTLQKINIQDILDSGIAPAAIYQEINSIEDINTILKNIHYRHF